MDSVISYFDSLGIDLVGFLQSGGIALVGLLVIALLARFIFGKKATLTGAVSSAIGILFIYAVTAVVKSAGAPFEESLAPLPFVHFVGDEMRLFSFAGSDYTVICSELLSMVILAFLMNILDDLLPKGKNLFTWLLFRCLSVLLGMLAHLIVTGLLTTYLPEGLVTYAPAILLGILLVMLLTGAAKILVGAVIGSVNPLIGALYTFFFANALGKKVTKAVLTTGLLSILVLVCQNMGIGAISIAAGALVAYIPYLILLVVAWFVVSRIL